MIFSEINFDVQNIDRPDKSFVGCMEVRNGDFLLNKKRFLKCKIQKVWKDTDPFPRKPLFETNTFRTVNYRYCWNFVIIINIYITFCAIKGDTVDDAIAGLFLKQLFRQSLSQKTFPISEVTSPLHHSSFLVHHSLILPS